MKARQAEDEFTQFVRTAQEPLSRMAVLLAGDRQGGEDLLQDALLKTYLAWSRIGRGAETAYARRVLTNLATDRWRRRRYEPRSVPLNGFEPAPGEASGFGAVEDRNQLVAELGRLGARERAMVVLRYYADLSEADVAEHFGVSVGTVKSTCSRALARLRVEADPSYVARKS